MKSLLFIFAFALPLLAPLPAGAACARDSDCGPDPQQICQQAGGRGTPYCFTYNCIGEDNICPPGRTCDVASRLCVRSGAGDASPAIKTESAQLGDPCWHSTNCAAFRVCRGGTCQPCANDGDCTERGGGRCLNAASPIAQCTRLGTERQGCASNDQCGEKVCQSGSCVFCRQNTDDCGPGRKCNAQGSCEADVPPIKPVKPELEIPIPGVSFSNITYKVSSRGERYLDVPFIAEYVRGVYRFIAGAVGIVAVVMLIWGGVQWMISRGESVTKAKETIRNALMGLVLVLGSYVLLFTINPELVSFKPIGIQIIPANAIEAARHAAGQSIHLTEADKRSGPPPPVPAAVSCAQTRIPQSVRDAAMAVQASSVIPAAVMLAQWAVESNYGEACVGGNCFGIKCSGAVEVFVVPENNNDIAWSRARTEATARCPAPCEVRRTREVLSGSEQRGYACFAYLDGTASFERLANLYLRNPSRYPWSEYAGNPEGFAKMVQAGGYATDPGYAAALTAVMRDQCLIP